MENFKKQNDHTRMGKIAVYMRAVNYLFNLLVLAFMATGCIEDTDLISTDPNYNGASENLSCDPVANCPQVCRYHVDTTGNDAANGRTWETAMRQIQPAINKAYCTMEACESITQCDVWVAGIPAAEANTVAGVEKIKIFGPDNNEDPSATIRLRDGVNMYGGFIGGEATPDEREFLLDRPAGGSAFDISFGGLPILKADGRIMEVAGSAHIDGFRFLDGQLAESASQRGGAIWARGPKVTVSNCTFSGNGGDRDMVQGGAIFVDGGDAEITYSTFEDNSALYGGAVAITGGSLSVDRCIFMNNSAAADGGAIHKTDAKDLLIQNSAFYYNAADEIGGAIKADSFDHRQDGTFPAHQSMTVLNSFFMANNALIGSAIDQEHSSDAAEGSIDNTIANCTFLENVDLSMGGTVGIQSGRVVNSIVWSNVTSGGIMVSAPEVSYSIVKDWALGGTTSNADPLIERVPETHPFISTLFVQPLKYTLSPNSPCIDAGDGDAAPEFDLMGNARNDDASVENTGIGAIVYTDIGAVEAVNTAEEVL